MGQKRRELRRLSDRDLPTAAALCRIDPAASILAASRINVAAQSGLQFSGGELWGYPAVGELEALVWVGTNVVPFNPHSVPGFAQAVAEALIARNRTMSSIVGTDVDVLEIWRLLEPRWAPAREVRPVQHSMTIGTEPLVDPDPRVRQATDLDFDCVFPACVAMFTEEVGYSPVQAAPHGYPQRVRWLIDTGCSWIIPNDGPSLDVPVQFKAEVGARSETLAQLQGVWVAPTLRGQGIAAPAVAAVVQALQTQGVTPALYVNDFNEPAIATYRAVGFERVGTYATVLF